MACTLGGARAVALWSRQRGRAVREHGSCSSRENIVLGEMRRDRVTTPVEYRIATPVECRVIQAQDSSSEHKKTSRSGLVVEF